MRIELRALDPARNIRRAWSIAASPDLFGAWVVQTSFGRIGSAGRVMVASHASEAAARASVARALRRRASAPRRIGVAYVERDGGM